jgi:protein phosphatase
VSAASSRESTDASPPVFPQASQSKRVDDAKPAAAPPVVERVPDALSEIPRLDFEEDEDVEPTKVGKVDDASIQPIVEKFVYDEGADETPPTDNPPLQVVYALAQTDVGKRRKQNQDSFLVLEKESVYVVADGMGGHRGGQHASQLAVKTMGDAFEQKNFDAAPHEGIPLKGSELARAIQMANAAIFGEAKRRPELSGMGTTLCAARFTEDSRRLYIGHVGDSRCYRLRDGVMKQMTTDHTMADYGVAGPDGSHLSRAVGVWPTVPIDLVMAAPKVGDIYLLCSDGLTKMIPDGTIATQLLHEEDPKAAVERLIFFANAHGGKDNITVMLLRVVEPGWAPPGQSS